MYLHSCQSTKRNKGYSWHIFRKSVCSAVFKGDRAWGLPPVKAETEIFRFFFLQQLPNPWFVISHVWCAAYSIHSSFLLPLYLLTIAFLFIFGSSFSPAFSVFIFLSHRFPLIFQNTLDYLGFFPFYNHRVLPSLSLPTLGTLPG